MNELVNHPDWMPLLLDDNGEVHPTGNCKVWAPFPVISYSWGPYKWPKING